jgi:hypothetical protein
VAAVENAALALELFFYVHIRRSFFQLLRPLVGERSAGSAWLSHVSPLDSPHSTFSGFIIAVELQVRKDAHGMASRHRFFAGHPEDRGSWERIFNT